MKRLVTWILMLAIFLMPACGVNTKQIPIKIEQQQTKGTCWAATLRMMVEKYKDVEIKECEVMNAINDRYGPPMADIDCCVPQPLTIKVSLEELLGIRKLYKIDLSAFGVSPAIMTQLPAATAADASTDKKAIAPVVVKAPDKLPAVFINPVPDMHPVTFLHPKTVQKLMGLLKEEIIKAGFTVETDKNKPHPLIVSLGIQAPRTISIMAKLEKNAPEAFHVDVSNLSYKTDSEVMRKALAGLVGKIKAKMPSEVAKAQAAPKAPMMIEIPNIPFLKSCQRGGDYQDIFVALDIVFKFRYQFFNRALTWDEVKSAINNGFVIMSMIAQPLGSSAHMHLITGYYENGKEQMLIIAETTLGMEYWTSYRDYLGSGRNVWEFAAVVTEEPSSKPMCNKVFEDYVCLKSQPTVSLTERIENFFRSLLN
jgi:hypothetical protein